ncbi:carbohydrate ABC transporter permease [Butyrivibrio sp. MC2013]|uniref:carbohydrate ABC transporter permease n=1 Tax=Butyrivibrio sp. MC2013 TaxID=1280686 RepID=UPI00041BFFCD|nr:carbohydrate ABC transporter permease [Butyrivibrio sp. MC2013]
MKTGKKTKIIFNLILSVLSLIWISPVFFVFLNVFKTKQEYNLGSLWLLPKGNNLMANLKALVTSRVLQSMSVTLLYALSGAVLAVIIAMFAAYGLTHLNIRHKFFWFIMIYCGTVFPFQVYLIPIFKAYQKLGLYNTRIGMILFYSAICIPYSMFVFRNFFLGIDKELCESARIEGASEFMILSRIFLPMSAAPVSIVFLSQFTWCWNDLMFGLTFTKSAQTRPIMASLSIMGGGNPPALFVACIASSLPTLILFFLLNDKFQKGFAYMSK